MKGIEHSLKNWEMFEQILNINAYGSLWGYFSSNYNISSPILDFNEHGEPKFDGTIVEHVYDQIAEKLDEDIDELYLIGHSMGGIVLRAMIKAIIMPRGDQWLWDQNSPKVRLLIQLASPNQGSKLTNMNFINTVDKIQSAIYLKLIGYPMRLVKSITNRFSFVDNAVSIEKVDTEERTTQLSQMRPGSRFLRWLNTDPTYVDVIPHYVFIGTKNRLLFTNLAWIDTPDEFDKEELIDRLKEEHGEETIEEILGNLTIPYHNDDQDIEEFIFNLEKELDEKLPEYEQDEESDLSKIFDEEAHEPNDGLVSISDASLPGAVIVDLGEYQNKLTHWGLCLWYLPFKQYEAVENKVKEILTREIGIEEAVQ